jgi:hypothetical protein
MTKDHEFLNTGNSSIAMTEKTSRAERGNDVRQYRGDLAQDQARRQLHRAGDYRWVAELPIPGPA